MLLASFTNRMSLRGPRTFEDWSALKNSIRDLVLVKVYGWSKYGGSRDNVRKEQLPTWYCQSCGREQVKVLPQYMIPTDEENVEFVRVCSGCKYTYEREDYTSLDDLTTIIRMPGQVITLANHVTIPIRY